jgi:hypothetical protein
MSEIVKNATYINLSKGDKYGIKVDDNKLTLPIALKDESEVKELEQQVRSLFDKTRTGADYIFVNPGSGFWNDNEGVEIHAGNSIAFSSNYYGHIHTSKKVNIGIDTILRHTLLGQRLKEYWRKEEKISQRDAQKRLEEITPLARPQ